MRATTRSIPKFSRAMRAARMLELSPLVTAASAPARSIPASREVVAVEAEADDLARRRSRWAGGGTRCGSCRSTATVWPEPLEADARARCPPGHTPRRRRARRLPARTRRMLPRRRRAAIGIAGLRASRRIGMLAARRPCPGRCEDATRRGVRRSGSSSAGRSPRPSRSTSGSRRRSRSRSSRPTRSRRPRTRPRRSSSSSPSARRASRSGLDTLVPIAIAVADPARDRRHVVPPDDLRLPERRRLLRRQPREPRREPVARRRRVAARRLHPHRRGVDLGRRRRHRLDPRVPTASPTTACCSASR